MGREGKIIKGVRQIIKERESYIKKEAWKARVISRN